MRALILLAALVGCYRPAIEPCQYTCSADEICPDGLNCNFQNICAVATSDRCPSNACGWPAISNVDPCSPAIQADQVTADWTIDTSIQIETGEPGTPVPQLAAVPAGARVAVVQQEGGPEALVIVVHDLTLKNGLSASGARPLILLVNGTAALNQGSFLSAGPGLVPTPGVDCAPAIDLIGLDATADNGGGGGGGGGFGQRVENTSSGAPGGSGGSPGSTINNGGKPGRLVPNTDALVPLRGGCAGGPGGSNGAEMGGRAGLGGGAVQISAKTSLVVRGLIAASAHGGGNSERPLAGGGGGGSGGGILLEAPTVTFELKASLCANGGGGGAASTGEQAFSACSEDGIVAGNGGGDQAAVFAAGGQGATALNDASPGKPGQTGTGTGLVRGAGGGGGGVGRIRINATTIVGAPKFSTPAFTSGPLL
jgi:hypothetical protein